MDSPGILAFAFIALGAMKLFAYEKYKALSEKKGPTGITRELVTFIGIAELAGGVGVILPMATGVAPWLTTWAAAGRAGLEDCTPPPGRRECAGIPVGQISRRVQQDCDIAIQFGRICDLSHRRAAAIAEVCPAG